MTLGGRGVSIETVYDVGAYIEGAPTASELLLRFVAARPLTIPPNLAGCQVTAGIAATAQADFALALNGSPLATLSWGAGATMATPPTLAATQLAPGDVLTLTAPASPDATLANLALTLALIR